MAQFPVPGRLVDPEFGGDPTMGQVIVGHFRDRETALKAASELRSRQLVVDEPRIVEHDYETMTLDELSNLDDRQHNLELIVLWVAAIAFVLGTIVMVFAGRMGVFAAAFPVLVALATMGFAGALFYGWKLLRGPDWHTHHMLSSDLVVAGAADADVIEDVLVDAGAEDVEVRIA